MGSPMQISSRPLRGAVAGVLATVAMSVLMLAGMLTGIAPMPEPIPKALAALVLGGAPKPLLMGAAILGHLGYGAAWGATLFATIEDAGTREGLGLGFGLWVLMGLVFLPALGWGLFGTGLDPRIAVATLVLHLVYGATIAPAFEALEPTDTAAQTPGAPGA
jgi:hypothetical protein